MFDAVHRDDSRWAGRYLAGLLMSATLGAFPACEDPDKMFEGVWESNDTVGPSEFIRGRPELAIGHFGKELTGIVRFLDDNGLEVEGCTCAFLDEQRVDLEAERFVVTSKCGEEVLLWVLGRTVIKGDDEVYLEGTVVPATGGVSVATMFRLIDDFVTQERRTCDE